MNKKLANVVKWMFFIAYLAVMVYFMFFAELLGRTEVTTEYRYNLVPFKEINRFFTYRAQLGFWVVCANLLGNVVAFLPLGLCLPMVSNHRIKLLQVFILSAVFSVAIELTQLLLKVGSCDVDDMMLNTLGGILGYFIFLIVKAHNKAKEKRNRRK